MFYDIIYRHNEALAPDALTTVSAALNAVNAAAIDCRRAGKQVAGDPALLLLIRNLAAVAERTAPDAASLRLACLSDRSAVIETPALLDLADTRIGGNQPAKRTFHYQARRALFRLAETLGLTTDDLHISSDMGRADDEGRTMLRHPSIAIYVIARGFVPNRQITYNLCDDGCDTGSTHYASLADLMDASALQSRIATMIGPVSAPRLALAA
jgi:hypothetical protein